MRKLLFNKKKDIGAIGIGAMIVLIAMILVAGVAATVLISTSNTLQIQAMRTGSQTLREVSGGLNVYSIYGLVNSTTDANGTTYDNIWCLAITVEGRPGSGRIDLNNTYILISDGSTKALVTYAYNDSTLFYSTEVTGDVFTAVNWSNLSNDKFAIGVLQDYDGSMSNSFYPALNRGDKAVLYIYMNTSATLNTRLEPRTEIFGQVIPEFGAPGVIAFTSPKAYAESVYQLQ
jgi:archaeal flagellin FlaB